jgi:hypothetical protein
MKESPKVLIPLNDCRLFKNAGFEYPSTESQARWLFRQRHSNGLAGAFVRIGRRVFIDLEQFNVLVSKRRT